MWIIYKHTNKINQKSYIGQTCQKPNERWRKGQGYHRSTKFYNAIQKYGWNNFEHDIIEENILTREEADQREKYWIQYYNSIENGYNISVGGTGMTSEQAKQYNQENWNNNKFKAIFCKPVICLNTQKIYSSIIEASKDTGIGKCSISACCRHRNQSCGKDINGEPYLWEYYIEGNVYKYQKPIHKNYKKIICLTTNEIFDTITEASNKYNINHACISDCCNFKQHTAGKLPDGTRLVWRYYQEDGNYKTSINTSGKTSKKVICIETKHIFNSIKEAADYVNGSASNISVCCKQTHKTCKGYHWMFYKDYNERAKTE